MENADRKCDWIYIYSEELQQQIAVHKKTGWIFAQDGTKYSPQEVAVLRKMGGIQKSMHAVKKMFEGTIVEVERKK